MPQQARTHIPSLPLTPALIALITHSISTNPTNTPTQRIATLSTLSRTCKAFHTSAQVLLYDALTFTDARRAQRLCTTLNTHNPSLALLVRSFWFCPQDARSHTRSTRVPIGFWKSIKDALVRMQNLEYLVLFCSINTDRGREENTCLFDIPFPFQLCEAKLRLPSTWDAHLTRFLASQRRLRVLHVGSVDMGDDEDGVGDGDDGSLDGSSTTVTQLPRGSLPSLETFDGPLNLALQLIATGCPLTHLQVVVPDTAEDADAKHFPGRLAALARVHRTLRGLSLLELSEEGVGPALGVVAGACPGLVHIGFVPLPLVHRHHFHHALMHMHALRSLQLDVSHWAPAPHLAAQRALAAELKAYCAGVRYVVFWIHTTRFRWHFSGQAQEWHSHVEVGVHPGMDGMWCLA